MNHEKAFTLKSGTNKGNRRIWIEGSRLASNGFRRGTRLARYMNDGGTMTLVPVKRDICLPKGVKVHTIAGTADRPILDLCGKWVTEFIGDSERFAVEIRPDSSMMIYPD